MFITKSWLAPRPPRSSFAGTSFAPTKRGGPRKSVLLKILRSGLVTARCTGITTDDYAWDAATNCRKGEANPQILAKEIEENPSGWWSDVIERDGVRTLRVCCHTFKGYDVVVNEEVAAENAERYVEELRSLEDYEQGRRDHWAQQEASAEAARAAYRAKRQAQLDEEQANVEEDDKLALIVIENPEEDSKSYGDRFESFFDA